MRISDDAGILNNAQRTLVSCIATERFGKYGFENRVCLIKIVEICGIDTPSSVFEDEEKKIITLNISPCHFSKQNIKFIICHEIQHRIDELKPSFGYDKDKKERLGQQYDQRCKHFSQVLAHLWDVYINGRLDKEGLYQTDPNETIGIKGQLYKECTPSTKRCADVHFLECRGFRNAEQVYNRVWSAKECELSYDQLADLAKEGLGIK